VKKLNQKNTDKVSLYLKVNSTIKYCRKNAGLLDFTVGDTLCFF